MYEHPYLSYQVTEFEQEQMERAAERRRLLIEHADQIVAAPGRSAAADAASDAGLAVAGGLAHCRCVTSAVRRGLRAGRRAVSRDSLRGPHADRRRGAPGCRRGVGR